MSCFFDLAIPRTALSRLTEFPERLVSWGGEPCRENSPRYSWRDVLTFTTTEMPKGISVRLPSVLSSSDLNFLSLDGDGLQQWRQWINANPLIPQAEAPLRTFLSEILPALGRYLVLLDLDDGPLPDPERSLPRQVISRIDAALRGDEDSRGFIAWL